MASWYTLEEARADWADAAQLEDDQLQSYLDAAKEAVIAYAPAVETPLVVIPDGYRIAQLMQVRNTWNAGTVAPSGDLDDGTYGLQTFPLDWKVQQLIRPKRAVPVVA